MGLFDIGSSGTMTKTSTLPPDGGWATTGGMEPNPFGAQTGGMEASPYGKAPSTNPYDPNAGSGNQVPESQGDHQLTSQQRILKSLYGTDANLTNTANWDGKIYKGPTATFTGANGQGTANAGYQLGGGFQTYMSQYDPLAISEAQVREGLAAGKAGSRPLSSAEIEQFMARPGASQQYQSLVASNSTPEMIAANAANAWTMDKNSTANIPVKNNPNNPGGGSPGAPTNPYLFANQPAAQPAGQTSNWLPGYAPTDPHGNPANYNANKQYIGPVGGGIPDPNIVGNFNASSPSGRGQPGTEPVGGGTIHGGGVRGVQTGSSGTSIDGTQYSNAAWQQVSAQGGNPNAAPQNGTGAGSTQLPPGTAAYAPNESGWVGTGTTNGSPQNQPARPNPLNPLPNRPVMSRDPAQTGGVDPRRPTMPGQSTGQNSYQFNGGQSIPMLPNGTPDYMALANAQSQYNQQNAREQSNLNNPNQYNPYGSQVRTQNPDGTYSVTQSLNPQQQQNLDIATGLKTQLLGNAQQAAGRQLSYENVPGSPTFDPSKAPSIGQFDTSGVQDIPQANGDTLNAARDALYQQQTQYLDPQFQQAQSDMESKLANQGLMRGSEAFNREMDNFNRTKQKAYGDARNSSILAGGAEQSRLFNLGLQANQAGQANALNRFNTGLQSHQTGINDQLAGFNTGMQGRQQGVSEQNALHNSGINDLNALNGLSNYQLPTFAPGSSTSIPGVDYMNAANQGFNATMGVNNAAAAREAAQNAGLFGLGSTFLNSSAGQSFLNSLYGGASNLFNLGGYNGNINYGGAVPEYGYPEIEGGVV